MAITEDVALVRQGPTVIAPKTLAEMIDLAERLSKSTLLPEALRGKVADVLMQIGAGQEMGLYPMASLRSFHVIAGKPVMTSDAMVAVVLGSGKAEYFRRVEESDKSVTYATKRRGDPERRCTWTIEMAKTASLHTKDTWRAHPRQMLAARAKAELARDVFPDVLAGCYTADELDERMERSPDARSEVQDAEWSDHPRVMVEPAAPFDLVDYPEISEIANATSVEELRGLAARFVARKLGPGAAYDAMSAAYTARVKWLKNRPVSNGEGETQPAETVQS